MADKPNKSNFARLVFSEMADKTDADWFVTQATTRSHEHTSTPFTGDQAYSYYRWLCKNEPGGNGTPIAPGAWSGQVKKGRSGPAKVTVAGLEAAAAVGKMARAVGDDIGEAVDHDDLDEVA